MFSDRGKEPLGISQQFYHQPALLRRKGTPYVQHIPFFSGQGNRVSIFGKKLRQGDPKPPAYLIQGLYRRCLMAAVPAAYGGLGKSAVFCQRVFGPVPLCTEPDNFVEIFNLAHIPQYLQAYNSALYITCLKSLFRYFHWPSIYGWFYCRSRSFLLLVCAYFPFLHSYPQIVKYNHKTFPHILTMIIMGVIIFSIKGI